MDHQENSKSTLSKLLREEIQCANTLLNSLKAERAVLASNNPGLVEVDSAEKIKQINGLQQATTSRLAYMERHNLEAPENKKTEQNFMSESDAILDSLFTQLSQFARDCYAENRVIGQLVNRRTQFITQILDTLSPSSRNPYAVTYAENGNMSGDTRNTLLDLAQT